MKIDAHQHFWALGRGDYTWLTPELKPLYRDFGPVDLAPILESHAIAGVVLVQAAPTDAETTYLLSLADKYAFIMGVVGWLDFEAHDAPKRISQLAKHPKLAGLRPMIQDISDVDWMLQDTLTPAFLAMIDHNLVFDALTKPIHLPNLRRLCLRHPDLTVIIDHGSKPNIADQAFDPWAAEMTKIAEQTKAYVKLSGLLTEAGADWSIADLAPYVDHLIVQFEPHRIIWGSDWPVCTLASDYDGWVAVTTALLAKCTPTERAAIWGENANVVYRLKGRSL